MKLTVEHLESLVASEQYHVFEGTTMTVCCLTLKNGFAAAGFSACIRPEDFDEVVGREIARANAIDKLWELEGYRIKASA
jgi:hypothetical protein